MDDRVKAEGWLDAEAKGLALRTKYPDLYSDSKLIAALEAKTSLVDGVRLALHSAEATCSEWDWPQLGPQLQNATEEFEVFWLCSFLISTTVVRSDQQSNERGLLGARAHI